MTQTTNSYAYRAELDLPIDAAIEKVTAALKEEGFGILTEIDIKSTLKKKLDADFRKYIILGACNPVLAHQAFQTELEIGLLLPCNVIVYENEAQNGSVVSIVDPIAMLGMVINPNLESVAHEAEARLKRIYAKLSA